MSNTMVGGKKQRVHDLKVFSQEKFNVEKKIALTPLSYRANSMNCDGGG